MSRNRRNGYEEDTSYMRGGKARGRALNASYNNYDEEDDNYTGYEDYNTGYEDDTFSGVYDDSSDPNYYDDEYGDEDYEDYGELGSNYDTKYDPNYGYDYFDEFEDVANKRRNTRKKAERANDFVDDFQTFSPTERSDMMNANRRGGQRMQNDLTKYLDYLEKYDRGEINNYEMSKIQRKYANNPFWETFRPSRDLIKKYGSGNKSTRWPMFKNEGGQWRPEIWRND